MSRSIYLDYSATTPCDQRVVDKMVQCLTIDGNFGNPASRSHKFGWDAEKAVETAREQVAALINADPREIVFTSGATEADNLAVKGAALFYQTKGKHLITVKTEHKAVLDPMRQLERQGFEVTYLDVNEKGVVELDKFVEAIRPDTIFASVMMVNNETGVLQHVKEMAKICREKGIIFHTDATQAVGKLPVDVKDLGVDLASFSAHKLYGPKGVGGLYVCRRPRVRLEAIQHGGGHERGLRSGTLPTHQIVGMGEAYRIAKEELPEEMARIQALKDRLWNGLKGLEEVYLNGDYDFSAPGILNVSFNYIEGESLMMALKNIAVSSGSACTSASLEPSYVLRAYGRNDELAHSSIRFSIGRFTTEADIDETITLVTNAVNKLRDLSPLWDFYKKGISLDSITWTAH